MAGETDEGKGGRGLGYRTVLGLRKRRLWDDSAAPGFLKAFLWLPWCIFTYLEDSVS